jgi:ubiquinone/menaquinone biosynthesis C-methylase UbiE
LHHHYSAFYHDEETRRKWQNPEAILADIGLKPGFTFIDVGCGEGFFAIPAAKIVGKKGRVYGIDTYNEAIEHLMMKAANEDLNNLETKVGAAEETVVCRACADIIFFGIDFHDFRESAKVLANAKQMLKPTGRLIDLDWKKKQMEIGPPLQIRFSEEEAMSRIKEAGFEIESVKDVSSYHYLIIAKLKER